MSGEEGELAGRYYFQNLVSERKEKKVTRGECWCERRALFVLLVRDLRIFSEWKESTGKKRVKIWQRREDDSWSKILRKWEERCYRGQLKRLDLEGCEVLH